MIKNIILTIIVFVLAVSLGFTSCKNKASISPAEIQSNDSVIPSVPDTNTHQIALADSSWDKAVKSFKTEPDLPKDSKVKKGEITIGGPKAPTTSKPNPLKPKELLDGLEKAKKNDLRGAIADFDRCIELNNKNYNAYFYKAKAFIDLNEPQNAIPNLNKAIEYNSTNPVIYYYRGKLLYEAGNTEKAYADFDKAVSINPEFPDALNYRGIIKEGMGKHTEAIADYNAAIKNSPSFSIAYYNLGTSQAALELYKDAIASFSKFIDLDDPTKVKGYMNRGNCYVMLKEFKAAISDYSSAITLDPKNANAYYNRGAAYQLSGDKNACNDWQKAESLGDKRAGEMLKEYCK